MTLPTVIAEKLKQQKVLADRIAKGEAIMPDHLGKSDPLSLKRESAWLALIDEYNRLEAEILSAWQRENFKLAWEFPADAPIAVIGLEECGPDWKRLKDGTLRSWLTYAEMRLVLAAVDSTD